MTWLSTLTGGQRMWMRRSHASAPLPTQPTSPMAHQVERPGLRGESGLLAASRSFSRIAAAAVILIGLLVVVGWAFDLEVLKRLLLGRLAMNPVTALAFILGGVSLRLSVAERPDPRTRRLARATGLAVAVVGLLRLGACLSGWDIGIDQWLFAAKLAASGNSVPNRMAPNTALTFVLIVLGLASLDRETSRGRRPAQSLGIAVAVVALIALLGYAYGVDHFYDVPSFIPMALPTALAFAVLSQSVP